MARPIAKLVVDDAEMKKYRAEIDEYTRVHGRPPFVSPESVARLIVRVIKVVKP